MSTTDLPACGLYRTTAPLPGNEDSVPAGRLVMFHNHSDDGRPIVLLPESNINNVWSYTDRGVLVEPDWALGLDALLPEGLYSFSQHFHPEQGKVVAQGQLVQLGYNAHGEPIVFFPQRDERTNSLIFPTSGMKIPPEIYALLAPLEITGVVSQDAPHHH